MQESSHVEHNLSHCRLLRREFQGRSCAHNRSRPGHLKYIEFFFNLETTHILVFEDHVPGHLLDGLSIGEAGGVRGQAELALESLLGMLLLDMPHSLSLDHLLFLIAMRMIPYISN